MKPLLFNRKGEHPFGCSPFRKFELQKYARNLLQNSGMYAIIKRLFFQKGILWLQVITSEKDVNEKS